jgi:hypothetical protein
MKGPIYSLTMLVAKYKRSDSDNEDGEESGSRPSKPVTSSVDDAKTSASTSYSSSTLPSSHRSLSIAPHIPDYQIAVRIYWVSLFDMYHASAGCKMGLSSLERPFMSSLLIMIDRNSIINKMCVSALIFVL